MESYTNNKLQGDLTNLRTNYYEDSALWNPYSEDKVKKFENETGYVFSKDYYLFLINFGLFNEFNKDMFSFWSLDKIKEEANSHPPGLIWFSEYFINLCNYGFDKNNNKIYTHFQHSEKIEFVANSFTEFINLYLEDSSLILK